MKKFLMVICCVLTFGLVLAGCSTSNISNDQNGIIYNGNAGTIVSGYLYYGNAFADVSSFTDQASYDSSAKTAYLNRLNLNEERDAKGKNFSPNGNEVINSEEVIAHESQFMFVIDEHLYFAKPDEHSYYIDGNLEQHYDYTTFCSININGGKINEYDYQGVVEQIEVQEFNGNYYVIAFANDNLVVTKLNNGNLDSHILATDVTSVAIPETAEAGASDEWNGMIYFTTTNERGNEITRQISVEAENGDSAKTISSKNGAVSFLYRANDYIVYTHTENNTTRVYFNNVKSATNSDKIISTDDANILSYNSPISNAFLLNYGTSAEMLIYDNSDGTLSFKNKVGGSGTITLSDGSADIADYEIMFFDGSLAYLMSGKAIYEVDFAPLANVRTSYTSQSLTGRTIVSMTAIQTKGTLYSYDGEYIYYYAQLEELTDEEQELINAEKEEAGIEVSDEEEEEGSITTTDSGCYLYRVRINNNNDTSRYELLGQTSYSERHSDYVYKK